MRALILMAMTLTLAACGQGFQASSKASVAAPIENASTISPLSSVDAAAIDGVSAQILVDLANSLQGLGGTSNFSLTGTSATVSASFTCPSGGTIALNSSATTSTTVTLTSIAGSLSDGSGSITYTACKFLNNNGAEVQLDGALMLDELAGTLDASVSVGSLSNAFTSTNKIRASGSIHVKTATTERDCSVSIESDSSASGSASLGASGGSVTGNIAFTTSSSICGKAVQQNLTMSF